MRISLVHEILVLVLVLLIQVSCVSNGEKEITNDPLESKIVTSDIENFWLVFDEIDTLNITDNPFNKSYFDIGSVGLLDFLGEKIIHPDSLLHTVLEHYEWYVELKPHTLKALEMEKKVRSVFYSLGYWYPKAEYPPVYFVVGRFNSGGTSTKNGIIIGMENSGPLKDLSYLIAHETIHFQQPSDTTNTLLAQCIIEGSADFIGELISGGNINAEKYVFGDKNKDKLCEEFVEVMHTSNFTDWLYEQSGKDDRPADLGYWMGYRITEQYFIRAPDKRQAVSEILNISNFKKFTKDSGFLDDYMKN